jgi:hypothetical protein
MHAGMVVGYGGRHVQVQVHETERVMVYGVWEYSKGCKVEENVSYSSTTRTALRIPTFPGPKAADKKFVLGSFRK